MPIPYNQLKGSGEIEAWVNNRVIFGDGCRVTRAEVTRDFQEFNEGTPRYHKFFTLTRHLHRYLREELGWAEAYVYKRLGYTGMALKDHISEVRCRAAKDKAQDSGSTLVEHVAELIMAYGEFGGTNEVSVTDLCARFMAVIDADELDGRELRLSAFGKALAIVAEDIEEMVKHRYSDGMYYRGVTFPQP